MKKAIPMIGMAFFVPHQEMNGTISPLNGAFEES